MVFHNFYNKRQLGSTVENSVASFLKNHGLKLISRNFHSYFGEIDLIMQDKDYLVFIEVRQRNNPYYGDGLMSVGKHKQQKIIKTAQYFLLKHPHYTKMPCRFDVVSVSKHEGINWVKNAFSS